LWQQRKKEEELPGYEAFFLSSKTISRPALERKEGEPEKGGDPRFPFFFGHGEGRKFGRNKGRKLGLRGPSLLFFLFLFSKRWACWGGEGFSWKREKRPSNLSAFCSLTSAQPVRPGL